MKHDPKATASALAVVGGGLYLICAVWTLVSRGSFMGLMNSWTHGIELSSLPSKTPDFGTLIIGFVTFVLAAWLTGYAFAYFRVPKTMDFRPWMKATRKEAFSERNHGF